MLILCLSIGEVPISFQSGSNEVPMETGGTQGANHRQNRGIWCLLFFAAVARNTQKDGKKYRLVYAQPRDNEKDTTEVMKSQWSVLTVFV